MYIEPVEQSPVASMEQGSTIEPPLAKRPSFKQDSIHFWSQLQELLQVEYSILQKGTVQAELENETKQERINQLNQTLNKYHQTLLRFKDLRSKETKKQNMLLQKNDEQLQNLLVLLMKNQKLFASIIHSQLEINTHGLDDFVFDLFTFIYDPIVGAGMGQGVYKFMSELLLLEIKNLRSPNDFFDHNNLVCRFLLGYSKGPQCQAYLQAVIGGALNLLMNVKEPLEINSRNVYEQLMHAKEQREARSGRNKDSDRHRKNIIQRVHEFIVGSGSQGTAHELTLYEAKKRDIRASSEELESLIQQITPAIQSFCQTPLGRVVDKEILQETAKTLYQRRKVIEMIINSVCENLLKSLNKIPFIMRALSKLLVQLFQSHFAYMKEQDCHNLLAQFLIGKWLSSEFEQMYLNTCLQDKSQTQYGHVNITMIKKLLLEVWRYESQDFKLTIQRSDILGFYKELIQIPTTQLTFYIRDEKDENKIQSYMLSLRDVQILTGTIAKSKIESSLSSHQLAPYKELKQLSERIIENQKSDTYFQSIQLGVPGKDQNQQFEQNGKHPPTQQHIRSHPNLHHFVITKFSELYQVNYVDVAFKFNDPARYKSSGKQEEKLFVGKAKQVIAQFLITIERISALSKFSKLRNNAVLTFDNLIQLYKDSYETKGVSIKQYENISPQLYANYLLSIYKIIPEDYISNNLSLLCEEMRTEFEEKVQIAKSQQKAMTELYLRLITQLTSERGEIKAHNQLLKKTELQKEINTYFKFLKMPCVIQFQKGIIQISTLSSSTKYKTLEPQEQDKAAFLNILNSSDPRTVQLEIAFSTIRDFVDLFSGMKLFELALNGDELAKSTVREIYNQYIGLLEEKMLQQKRICPPLEIKTEQTKNRQTYYLALAYQWLEKSIVRRIMLKQQFEIQPDEEFYQLCLAKQKLTLKQHGIEEFESEVRMLRQLSEQLKQLDTCVTHLEKLEVIKDCQSNIFNLIVISGIGGGGEGQDVALPLFIYLMIQAAPKYMVKHKNLIEIFFNEQRWSKLDQNYSYNYAHTQLISAFGAIK